MITAKEAYYLSYNNDPFSFENNIKGIEGAISRATRDGVYNCKAPVTMAFFPELITYFKDRGYYCYANADFLIVDWSNV